jgi:FkbM family methyltransferase
MLAIPRVRLGRAHERTRQELLMSLMTSPTAMWLRNQLRAAGLTKPLALLLANNKYEARVDEALFKSVRGGDIVWDVGANVGYYTTRIADAVGPNGQVVAFEPSPRNLTRLRQACDGRSNISIIPLGLSNSSGQVSFNEGKDDLGATSAIVLGKAGDLTVDVAAGDELIRTGAAPTPTMLKIDVEGHEYTVLKGMRTSLSLPILHTILVEVHFTQLAHNGEPGAPRAIEAMLVDSGFHVSWIDASHLLAKRRCG